MTLFDPSEFRSNKGHDTTRLLAQLLRPSLRYLYFREGSAEARHPDAYNLRLAFRRFTREKSNNLTPATKLDSEIGVGPTQELLRRSGAPLR